MKRRLRFRSLLKRMRWSASALTVLTGAGCADLNEWKVVQFCSQHGIQATDAGGRLSEIAHGVREFDHLSDTRRWGSRWQLEWPGPWYAARVTSGDVSRDGLAAIAWRDGPGQSDLTEILHLRDGQRVARMKNHPLAVRWSNDDTTLAILEAADPPSTTDRTRLLLWQPDAGTIATWGLDEMFRPSTSRADSDPLLNRFGISWNATDSQVALSTKNAPLSELPPKACIVRVVDGQFLWSGKASDVHFIDAERFAYTAYGPKEGGSGTEAVLHDFRGVFIGRLRDGQLTRDHELFRASACAASDPKSGMFLVWQPPLLPDIKVFSLPMVLHDAKGALPATYGTGFVADSSFRLMRKSELESCLSGRASTTAHLAKASTHGL